MLQKKVLPTAERLELEPESFGPNERRFLFVDWILSFCVADEPLIFASKNENIFGEQRNQTDEKW